MPVSLVEKANQVRRWEHPPIGRERVIPPFVMLGGALPSRMGGMALPNGEVVKPGEYIVEVYRALHRSADGSYAHLI